MPRKCNNCTKGTACRPGGLCWKCYYTPGVRDRFPAPRGPAVKGVRCRTCPWEGGKLRKGQCMTCYMRAYRLADKVRREAVRRCDDRQPRGRRVLPGQPTRALPGTPEKIRVLCARYDRREGLFHERDAR